MNKRVKHSGVSAYAAAMAVLVLAPSLALSNAAVAQTKTVKTAPAAVTAAPRPAQSPQPPAPGYAVVEGAHQESADVFQSLTILCPAGLKAFGAGFTAVVRNPDKIKDAKPTYHEEGLNDVRSLPDSAGLGWRIEGISPGAAATKQPWRLAGRVVCVRLGG